MAIATPENSTQSLLTEAEQAALDQQSMLQTARAVEALAGLTSELGGEEMLVPMADSMRDRMAMMTLREQRQFRRSLEKAGRLLLETSVAGLGDVLPFHEVHEVVDTPEAESSADKPTEDSLKATDAPAQAEEIDTTSAGQTEQSAIEGEGETTASETIAEEVSAKAATQTDQEVEEAASDQDGAMVFDKKAVVDFLTKVNRRTVPEGLVEIDTNDDDMVRAIISLYPHESNKVKLAITSASRLTMMLEGKTFEEIADIEAQEGVTLSKGAYDQFKKTGAPVFVAKHLSRLTDEAKAPVEPAAPKVEASPSLRRDDADEQPAELASGIRMLDQAPRPERPLEEEPDFVQVAERLTNIIGWDGNYRTAFRALIDPSNRTTVITRGKAEACEMFITAMLDSGLKELEDKELGLRREQVIQLYRLVGIRYVSNRQGHSALTSVGRDDMTSVYEQIDMSKRNGRIARETERSIFNALRKVVEYLETHQPAAVR